MIVGQSETLVELNYLNYFEDEEEFSYLKCNDTESITTVSSFLTTPLQDLTVNTSVVCPDIFTPRKLHLKQCFSGYPALCVDCSDPCSDAISACMNNPDIIAPCTSMDNRQCAYGGVLPI